MMLRVEGSMFDEKNVQPILSIILHKDIPYWTDKKHSSRGSIMQFLRDVSVVSLGVFLGFVVIVNTHEIVDIVHGFVQLQDLRLTSLFNTK